MTEETIKLATQVVLLLAAVVGLWKVWKTPTPGGQPGPVTSGGAQSNPENKSGPFDPFISLIAAYATALAPLLFVFAFIALITLMGSMTGSRKTPKSSESEMQIAITNPTAAEQRMVKQLEIAKLVAAPNEKDALLTDLVSNALEAGSVKVAAVAAVSLAAPTRRDDQLVKVTQAALKAGDLETATYSSSSISAPALKDRELQSVFRTLATPTGKTK